MSDHKKRKTNYSQNYNKKNNRHYMEIGQHGFLATCNFREKDCKKLSIYNVINGYNKQLNYLSGTRECYNILNQYLNDVPVAEVMEGDDIKKEDDEQEEIDISSQLENAIVDTKKSNTNRVFQGEFKLNMVQSQCYLVSEGFKTSFFLCDFLPATTKVITIITMFLSFLKKKIYSLYFIGT